MVSRYAFMKRPITSFFFASTSALVTMVRMVWPRTSAASVALATTRILPSSISLRPNGGAAQPMSTWSVITAVRVEEGLPVGVGFALTSNSLTKARTTLFVDEPLVENAMVFLSVVSLSVLIGDEVLAYQ